MRRSIRDALVGFSLIGAIVAVVGTHLWMRGVKLGSNVWQVTVSFPDASGLSERSPVTYRGVIVGSVSKIDVTAKAVLAQLEISHSELRLPKPVFATITTSSLLGGNSKIALISNDKELINNSPLPNAKDCSPSIILCSGDVIPGKPLASISTVAHTLQRVLEQAESENIFEDLDGLISQLKRDLEKAIPIINNLTNATGHINNVVAAIDNPKTINELKQTVSTARSLTSKINAVGDDLEALTGDPEFMNAVRSVTIGLGQFFNELYPTKTISTNK